MSDTNEPLSAVIAEMRAARNAASDMTLVPTEWLTQWADRIEAAAKRRCATLEDALSHCREYAKKIERENEEGETRLDAEEIIATVDNEFAGIRPEHAPGNAAAMRAALERIDALRPALGGFVEPIDGDSSAIYQNARWNGKEFLGKEIPAWWGAKWRNDLANAINTARAALAAPARNCDVGTAEEQAERHERFCAAHYKADAVDAQCFGCPASDKKGTDCEFVWGQLPFAPAEGGEK